jgi:hypothetical protein
VSNEALRLDVASSEVFELNTFGGNDTLTSSLENTVISGYIDGNNLDRVFQIRGDTQDRQTSRASSLQNTLVSSYAKAGPQPEVNRYLATDPSSEVDNSLKVKAAAGTQVGSEGVKASSPQGFGGYYDMSSPY